MSKKNNFKKLLHKMGNRQNERKNIQNDGKQFKSNFDHVFC